MVNQITFLDEFICALNTLGLAATTFKLLEMEHINLAPHNYCFYLPDASETYTYWLHTFIQVPAGCMISDYPPATLHRDEAPEDIVNLVFQVEESVGVEGELIHFMVQCIGFRDPEEETTILSVEVEDGSGKKRGKMRLADAEMGDKTEPKELTT